MKKTARIIWAIIIFLFALGCAYVSVVFIVGSGFIFGDIDYTEAQRQTAEKKAAILSAFGFLSLCVSILLMFLSGRIARLILKFVGPDDEW